MSKLIQIWMILSVLISVIIFNINGTILLNESNKLWNDEDFIQIISKILDYYKIKNILIFPSQNLIQDRIIDNLKILHNENYTKIIILSYEKNLQFYKIINLQNTLSIVYFKTFNDIIPPIKKCLRKIRSISKIIFIKLINNNSNNEIKKDIKFLFKWTRQISLINSIILIKNSKNLNQIEIYGYNSWPKLKIKNFTSSSLTLSSSTIEKFFKVNIYDKNLIKNYCKLKIIMALHLPKIFCTNKKNCFNTLSGYAGHILYEFLKTFNCSSSSSYKIYEIDDKKIQKYTTLYIHELMLKYNIDISTLPYDLANNYNSYFDTSYPILLSKYCFIIPLNNEIPKFMYLILPFHLNLWLLIFITIFYSTFLLYFIKKFLLNKKYSNFSECLLNVICSIIYISLIKNFNLYKNLQLYFIYILLILLGFILTNIYLSLTTSFFTKILYNIQINNLQDIINNNLQILDEGQSLQSLEIFLNITNNEKFKLKNLLKIINENDYIDQTNQLNTTLAFIAETDEINIIFKQQEYLKRKKFYQSKICFGEHYVTFLLKYDTIIKNHLNLFLLKIQENGLLNYWKLSSYTDLINMKYLKTMYDYNNEYERQPINLEHLMILWYCYIIGILLSLLCFLLEILRYSVFKK